MRHLMLASTAIVAARAFASTPPAAPAAAATKPKADRVEPVLTGVASIDMPVRSTRRGSESKYPFDSLTAVGQAFGVKNKTAKQLSSIVSNANKKALTQATDEAGNKLFETKNLTDAAGAVVGTVPDTDKPKMIATKHFYAVDVTADLKAKIKGTPLEGSSALVARDK